MRDRLLRLAEMADLALASAIGVLDEGDLKPLRDSISSLRIRLAHPPALVVALAGGTGSGKSSLLNALVGSDIAEVGGVRPTTSSPLGVLPNANDEGLSELLARMGIHDIHKYDGPLCLVDMPDFDSVEYGHRRVVDELIRLVDVVVWVTDPEKYRDARLHHDYLAPLARYRSQFVFALNQIDRLEESSLRAVLTDFAKALEEDGIPGATVLPVAASPPAGPAIGISELEARVRQMADDGAVLEKLEVDLGEVASSLSDRLGTSLDFDRRAAEMVESATSSIVASDTNAASKTLGQFLDLLTAENPGPVGEAIGRISADVPRHIARIAQELSPEPIRSRFRKTERNIDPDPVETTMRINSDVIRPVRVVLAKRALAVASIAELVVEMQAGTNPRAD